MYGSAATTITPNAVPRPASYQYQTSSASATISQSAGHR